MLLMLISAMILSGAVTYAIFLIFQAYYRNAGVQPGDSLAEWRQLIRTFGDFNVSLILFIPLAVMFFYLLTRRYNRYFDAISEGIRRLAGGDFAHRVDIDASDEFGAIAADINQASAKLEQALIRGDFAEHSKDRLVVNLAHDLRTPLTSIVGYIDLLLQDRRLTEEQSRHYLTIVRNKSRRVERLIDELFEVARLNYGKQAIDPSPLNAGDLLAQLAEEMVPVLERSGLTARVNTQPGLIVSGDGTMLVRVFENLAANAARYGSDGEYVDFDAFADPDDAGTVVIRIANYGAVIPESDIPHLFDMFYTGDPSRTQREGGTGIGLFIAKQIVEQHGGTISCTSSVARTVFEIRLARAADDGEATTIL